VVHGGDPAPFVLLGAKSDLTGERRRVTTEAAMQLANELGVPYFEVRPSAR
jgi:hypothetical protein